MGIGGSDGAFYEDDFDRLTGNDGNKPEEEPSAGSKGSRSPSDVSITFRGTPSPSGSAASGSKRTPLDPNTPGMVNPDLNPNLNTKDWNEWTPNNIPTPLFNKDTDQMNVSYGLGEPFLRFKAEEPAPGGGRTNIQKILGINGPAAGPTPNNLSIMNTLHGMLQGPNTEEDMNILKGFYDKVKSGFTLMGDVFGGKIDPMSDQGIQRANDLAGLMVFGPAPVASKMADGTLGSFAGVRSLQNIIKRGEEPELGKMIGLNNAKHLEEQGTHPDEIWTKTGWMKGPEGKWKYEIDDSKATFNPDWNSQGTIENEFAKNGISLDTRYAGGSQSKNTYSLRKWKSEEKVNPEDLPDNLRQLWENLQTGMVARPLSDILDHPELYKAYPELKNVNVVADKKAGTAYYDPENGNIHVNPDTRPGRSNYNTKDVLLHEIQHVIQGIEGFAQGGAPGTLGKQYKLKLQQDYDDFKTEAKRRLPEINQKYATKGALGLSNDDMDFIHKYSVISDKWETYQAAAKEEAYNNYLRLAGEAEARNTQTRELLTGPERRLTPPSATLDIDADKQAVFTGEGRWATPYGYRDRYGSVTPEAPGNVTNFRRAANDNFAEGDPRRPYNIREPDMIGDSRLDAIMERDWDRLGKEMKAHEERQKKENETLAKMKENGQKLDELHKGRDYLELNEFERARSDKLRKQFEDLSQSLWDPNKT